MTGDELIASANVATGARFGGGSFGSDGENPEAALINVNGTLYGTTTEPQGGTVYSISTTGTQRVLHSFAHYFGRDGSVPRASLVDVAGTLYGTTSAGGLLCRPVGCGTVFSITTGGVIKVLHSFGGGSDGAKPFASLINVNGTLYGTTTAGGSGCDCGTIFSITTSGSENVLYSFTGGPQDGATPLGNLINVNGTLYGTTYYGGSHCASSTKLGCGTVFSVTIAGSEKVLHTFGYGSDGANPAGGLINVNGMLYGTTEVGGPGKDGTVYSISATGTEKVLHGFSGHADGTFPVAGLINVHGTLYGTTLSGGTYFVCMAYGSCGTIFSVTTSGTEKVLYNFTGFSDGATPFAGLINLNGTLYGTTAFGGGDGCSYSFGCGTVFAFTPGGRNVRL